MYRWKAVERSDGWAYRGRKQHDLLAHAFKEIYPERILRQAEEAVAAIGAGELPDRLKTAVKAGAILRGRGLYESSIS